jgi:hypothetical protein
MPVMSPDTAIVNLVGEPLFERRSGGSLNVSVRATHPVLALRLVLHWSYERIGSDTETA